MHYNIVIVGGGSAGWSTASLLAKNKNNNITIIEPTDNNAIGVGESTLPFLNLFHDKIGLSGMDWLDVVDGTLKLTIEFENFKNNKIWSHPFSSGTGYEEMLIKKAIDGDTLVDDQLKYVNETYPLAIRRNEKFQDATLIKTDTYCHAPGYHIDSIKYGLMLKKFALENDNVTLVNGSVDKVEIFGDNINKIILDDCISYTADLFIDCTGFNNLLIGKTSAKWISASDRLFCDNGIAVQLPYNDDSQKVNATQCTALSSGWVWNVPLQDRIGTGYVYSSRHQTYEDAENEFSNYLENKGYSNLTFKKVPFKTGTWDESWKGNVVSIGLSSYFLEPLESTGIAIFHSQILKLHDTLLQNIKIENKRNTFNTHTKNMVIDTLEFVEMHYTLTDRKDTKFWNECQKPLNTYQQHLMDSFTRKDMIFDKTTQVKYLGRRSFFTEQSWALMFLGYGIKPNSI